MGDHVPSFTFMHIKAILNDSCRDDREPNFVSHKFTVSHDTQEQLRDVFNKAMQEIYTMQGMIYLKDQKKINDLNNLAFLPMHMIARFEFEVKQITGQYEIDSGVKPS
jgi:hypothetical protein